MQITEKQERCIRYIQAKTGLKFNGKTREEAIAWIDEHKPEADKIAEKREEHAPKKRKQRQQVRGPLVTMDYEKLRRLAIENGITMTDLNRMLGQGKSFLSQRHVMHDDTIPVAIAEMIQAKTGISKIEFCVTPAAEPTQMAIRIEPVMPEPVKPDPEDVGLRIHLNKDLSDTVVSFCRLAGQDPDEYVFELIREDIEQKLAFLRENFGAKS